MRVPCCRVGESRRPGRAHEFRELIARRTSRSRCSTCWAPPRDGPGGRGGGPWRCRTPAANRTAAGVGTAGYRGSPARSWWTCAPFWRLALRRGERADAAVHAVENWIRPRWAGRQETWRAGAPGCRRREPTPAANRTARPVDLVLPTALTSRRPPRSRPRWPTTPPAGRVAGPDGLAVIPLSSWPPGCCARRLAGRRHDDSQAASAPACAGRAPGAGCVASTATWPAVRAS